MKTIGFPISHKENENRRTIIPDDLRNFEYINYIYVEKGYGDILGIADSEYLNVGCHVEERKDILAKDIICDPKVGDAEYLEHLNLGQTIFGWIHATQNRDITDKIIKKKLTAYAWEKMFHQERHVFWRNNELAGEAAILHAFQCYGKMPYETKVAVLGKGNTARGAIKILNMFGAKVMQYDRHTEKLLREEIGQFDVIVNCVLWDIKRKDHIVYKSDLEKMRKNSLIIDISCDRNGAIETSIPTSIENPIYYIDGICHYVVDHTPSVFYKTFSFENSKVILPYLKQLITNEISISLKNSLIIENGNILDQEIIERQNR